MKFTCLQENLSKSLGIVSKAIPAKSAFPILSNVLISAEKGRLKLTASNLDTFITTYVGASVEDEGAITVPARLVREFVSNLTPTTLIAHLEDQVFHLSANKAKAKFNGMDPEDFPESPSLISENNFFELNPAAFGLTIGSVAFSASVDDSRPVFSGVYLSYKDKLLTVAASDGFRLSERVIEIDSPIAQFTALVPAKILLEVARIFNSSTEPVKVSISQEQNLVMFESEDTLVCTRVIEGQFPDYQRIVPTESIIKAELISEELMQAVKLASLFTSDDAHSIKLEFDPEGFVNLMATSQESGEHLSKIEAQVAGEPISVIFNSRYLLDFLNNTKAERLVLETNGSTNPCLIRPSEEKNYFHLIMPLQS